MHADPRLSGLVAAALAIAGLACGSPPSGETGEPPPSPVQRPPTAPPASWTADAGVAEDRGLFLRFGVTLGQGRDALAEESRATCARSGAPVSASAPSTLVRFGRPLERAEAALLLGPAPESRDFFRLADADARFSFARALLDVPASLALLYAAEYRVGSQALDPAGLEWLVPPGGPDFTVRCGDHFTSRIEMGGQLFVLYRIDFASDADREAFVASAGADPAAWEVSALVFDFARRYPRRVDVQVSVLQIGGDVTAIGRILDVPWTQPVGCRAVNLWNCDLFLRGAVEYALAQGPGTFADSVRAMPAQLGQRLEPWTALGAAPAVRLPGAEVEAARAALRRELEVQLVLGERLRALRGGVIAVPPDLGSLVWGWQSVVDGNLAVLHAAETGCYDLVTDPADAQQAAQCAAGATPEGLAAAGYDATLELGWLDLP